MSIRKIQPFACECCTERVLIGHGDHENVGLCETCYEEAGFENEHVDGGHEPGAFPDECPYCRTSDDEMLPALAIMAAAQL